MREQPKIPQLSPDEQYQQFLEIQGREHTHGTLVANLFVDAAIQHLGRLPEKISGQIINDPVALATFIGSYVRVSAGSAADLVGVVDDIGIALRDNIAEALFKMTREQKDPE